MSFSCSYAKKEGVKVLSSSVSRRRPRRLLLVVEYFFIFFSHTILHPYKCVGSPSSLLVQCRRDDHHFFYIILQCLMGVVSPRFSREVECHKILRFSAPQSFVIQMKGLWIYEKKNCDLHSSLTCVSMSIRWGTISFCFALNEKLFWHFPWYQVQENSNFRT